MAGWKVDQSIEDVQYFLLNLGIFYCTHPYTPTRIKWWCPTIRVHVTMFNFWLSGYKGLTLQKPWSKSFQPTNHACSFLSGCSTGGREKTWVVEEPAFAVSAACIESRNFESKSSKKKLIKKSICALLKSHRFLLLVVVSSSSLKKLIGKKKRFPNCAWQRFSNHTHRNSPESWLMRNKVAILESRKSHCYSHLKPKVSPHLLMVSWDYVSVSSSGCIWKMFFSTNFLQRWVILKSSPYLFCWVKGPYSMKLSILSGQTHNMSLLAGLMCSHTTGWLPTTFLSQPFSIIS